MEDSLTSHTSGGYLSVSADNFSLHWFENMSDSMVPRGLTHVAANSPLGLLSPLDTKERQQSPRENFAPDPRR